MIHPTDYVSIEFFVTLAILVVMIGAVVVAMYGDDE